MKPLRSVPSNYFLRNQEIPFPKVREKVAINKQQDQTILKIFEDYSQSEFSAWDIFDIAGWRGYGYLITSIRRSITTLKRAGIIVKTGQKMERENSINNLWQLKK